MERDPSQLKLFTIRDGVIAFHHYLFPNVIEITLQHSQGGEFEPDPFVEDLGVVHELYPEPPEAA